MSEREVSESEITNRLENIIAGEDRIRIKHTLRLLAILINNIRCDQETLEEEVKKIKGGLLKVFKSEDLIEEEVKENEECIGYYV